MKKTLVSSLVVATIVILASATVLAQDAITINGGSETVLVRGKHQVQQPFHKKAGLTQIYSNLGSGTSVYQEDVGWTISGETSAPGCWVQGSAFTPTANATLTEIVVAFTWVEGSPNSGTIQLYSDDNGKPGMVLRTFKPVSNLPTFGTTSSILQTVATKGIAVTAGTQYWVVLKSPSPTWNVWNYSNSATGSEAYNYSDQGWVTRQSYLGAFAVYGQ